MFTPFNSSITARKTACHLPQSNDLFLFSSIRAVAFQTGFCPFILECVCACVLSYAVLSYAPTLCNPLDYSLLDSSIHGIFQVRILEKIAICYSRESSQPRDRPSSLESPVLVGWFFTTLPPGKLSFWNGHLYTSSLMFSWKLFAQCTILTAVSSSSNSDSSKSILGEKESPCFWVSLLAFSRPSVSYINHFQALTSKVEPFSDISITSCPSIIGEASINIWSCGELISKAIQKIPLNCPKYSICC